MGINMVFSDPSFEWDEGKNQLNQEKHRVSFSLAQHAFSDPGRLVVFDKSHSKDIENRYFCYGKVAGGVLTVRFTYREAKIRIFGAGFWREGKAKYEKENKVP